MPAVARMVREETPRKFVIFVLHQNAHPPGFAGLIIHVLLPDDRQEQRTRRIHDRDVGQHPLAIIFLQQLDHAEEERMLRHGAHCVVGDTRGHGTANPCWVCEERVQTAVATLWGIRIKSIGTPARESIHHPGRYRYHRNAPE